MFESLRRSRAILGMVAVGAAVAVSSFGIVRAERPNPDAGKIYHCSSGTACVGGSSTGGGAWGVWGIAPTDGVVGVTTSTSGKAGVRGLSTGTTGLADGVFGKSSNGNGVVGVSLAKAASGVHGFNDKGVGVTADSKGSGTFALVSIADSHNTAIFQGYNSVNGGHCSIDSNANLSCTGTIDGGTALRSTHRNDRGQRVLAYAAESATATIEDVGTARMNGGVAEVRFDSAFASMMDRRWYYVFLTPLGDTRGLYVSMKTPLGFQVRETERGRSNIEFDYRIVAHPIDAGNERLPVASR
jgi:hypothetical protein